MPPPPAAWLEQRAAHDESVALVLPGATLSYARLRDATHGLARTLIRHGVRPGEVLGVAVDSVALVARLLHGAFHLGCPLFPIHPKMPAAGVGELLARCRVRWLVAERAFPGVRTLAPAGLQATRESVAAVAARPLDASDLHLLCATSGSTGSPRCVMLSGLSLAASARAANARLGLTAGDTWLLCLPLYHVGGLSVLLRCALSGARVVLHEGFDPRRVLLDLARLQVTHISLVPALLARLLEAVPGPPPPSLRVVLLGGGPLSPALAALARRLGWPLQPTYGLSEAASQVATLTEWPDDWRPGLVGTPLEGWELRIRPSGGAAGRICLRGPALMLGYANPELRPGDGLEDGWLVTGDLGHLDAAGRLWISGRADDVLVTGGENVHPWEVESILADCPGVREVAVAGVSDPVWGQVLVAFVVGSAPMALVEQWARERLRGPWRPRRFVAVARLPCNAMGKLDRRALGQL